MRVLLGSLLLAALGLTAGCGHVTGPEKVADWLSDRSDVASVEVLPTADDGDEQVRVHLASGRTDDEVWDFVADFESVAEDADVITDASYDLDVDGFVAYLPSYEPSEGETRTQAHAELVQALWLRDDGRATSMDDGSAVSVETLVTAPARDVAAVVLGLAATGADTGASIRVSSPDGSVAVEWTTRMDFAPDLAAVRALAALQRRYPATTGWVDGIRGESRTGVVFSPDDISLVAVRRRHATLVPAALRGEKAEIGWGVAVSDVVSFLDMTQGAAVRRTWEAVSAVPGAVPVGLATLDGDVGATDLVSLRALRRVILAHPHGLVHDIAYTPRPPRFVGHGRDAVFVVPAESRPDVAAAYESLVGLTGLERFQAYGRWIEVREDVDEAQLRTILTTMLTLAPLGDPRAARPQPEGVAAVTVVVVDPATGDVQQAVVELAPDGTAGHRTVGSQTAPPATVDRIEAVWRDLRR